MPLRENTRPTASDPTRAARHGRNGYRIPPPFDICRPLGWSSKYSHMYQKADTRFGKIIKLRLTRTLLRRGGGTIATSAQVDQPRGGTDVTMYLPVHGGIRRRRYTVD